MIPISNWVQSWSNQDIADWQKENKILKRVIIWLENDSWPKQSELMGEPVELRTMCALWKSLRFQDGVLYRQWKPKKKPLKCCIVAPDNIREDIFDHLHTHCTGGHLVIKRSIAKIRSRFFWPGCKSDDNRWVAGCEMYGCQVVNAFSRQTLHPAQVQAKPSSCWRSSGSHRAWHSRSAPSHQKRKHLHPHGLWLFH